MPRRSIRRSKGRLVRDSVERVKRERLDGRSKGAAPFFFYLSCTILIDNADTQLSSDSEVCRLVAVCWDDEVMVPPFFPDAAIDS